MRLSDIKPYKKNAKKHDKTQIKNVMQSIKEFGFVQPIVVDKNGIIIIGHCRYEALKKLGYKEISDDMVRVLDISETDAERLRLLDNKLNESDWDKNLLEEFVPNLDFSEYDLDWGFNLEMGTDITEDEPPQVDEEHEPISKIGDIYQLGEHRLMCGDSTDKDFVEKLMNGFKANLLLTDPPYNVDYEGKTKNKLKILNDKREEGEFKEFLRQAFSNAYDSLQNGGGFYIWFASKEHCNFETALNESGLEVRQELIWKKNSMTLGKQDYQWKHEPCLYGWKNGDSHNWYSDRSQTTILEFDKPLRNGDHPTMKPVELFSYLIQNSSKKDDIVLDLFGGSGTTIIACEQNKRRCFMMEYDPRYCDVIIKRWENFTGKKAVKLN